MKRIILFTFLLISTVTFAQAPQGISFQAIAFDSNGAPVASGNIGVRISILANSANGTIVYSETHVRTTNDQGLYNLNIGQGIVETGVFADINWGQNPMFFRVEVDAEGGTNYTVVGTNQFMSVPYALYAENSGNSPFAVNSDNRLGYDGGDVELEQPGSALWLTSPDGTKYKFTVNNSGQLVSTLGSGGSQTGIVQLSGVYTQDLNLDANTSYLVTGPMIMADGTTLNIPAGTTIRVAPVGVNSYIAISQGARIVANGEANNPIVFTSNANSPGSGDWGGIIICGRAPINSTAQGSTDTNVTEVGGLSYGGNIANDNSGSLEYVRIEYAGGMASGNSEINGISFYGVGNLTNVDFVQVYEVSDDGIEFFGGTVNASHISIVNAEDDSIDWTEGYTGTLTDVYVQHGTNHDKAFECDGYNTDFSNEGGYFSAPNVTNVTVIGDNTGGEAFRLRVGTQGIFTNLVITDFSEGFDIDGDSGDNPTGQGVLNDLLQVVNVTFNNVTTPLKNDTGVAFTNADFFSGIGNGTGTDYATWGTGWTR